MASDWEKTADGQYYKAICEVLLPVTPEAGAAVVLLRPTGGIAHGITAVEKGDPGKHSEIDTTVNLTELAHDDPTPASASFTEIVPGSDTTSQVVQLNLALHKGPPGQDGTMQWDPTDLAVTPVAGQIPVVNSGADGFELTSMRVVDRCNPSSISNSGSEEANSTLAQIAIPSRPYPRRLIVAATTIVTASGSATVDLVARLNGESDGNVVARCFGLGTAADRLIICSASPANSNNAFDLIAAGSGATLYVRTELQAGSTGSYTTSSATTLAQAWAVPVG